MTSALSRQQPRSAPVPGGGWLGGLFLEGYLLKEMIRPYFLGVAGGTTLLLGNQLFLYTDLLVKKGAPPLIMLQILILNLPAILVVTFPIAGLFATLLTLGRMGSDSEITAMRAAGISFRRIFFPILLVGAAISALSFGMNDYIVPLTNQKVRTLNQNLFISRDALLLDEKRLFRVDDNLWFYIGSINRNPAVSPSPGAAAPDQSPNQPASTQGEMQDLLILDRSSETGNLRFPQVITAQSARREGQSWNLQGAVVRRYDAQGRTYYEGQVGEMRLNVLQDLMNFVTGEKVSQEMSSRELGEKVKAMKAQNANSRELAQLETDFNLKFAIPLASFFAVLVSAPLGLQTVRQTGRYGGVAVAIILVFIYYVFLSLGRSLGRVETLPPWLAAWLPNLVFGGISSLLVWRVVR